jgi:hypothetical protein
VTATGVTGRGPALPGRLAGQFSAGSVRHRGYIIRPDGMGAGARRGDRGPCCIHRRGDVRGGLAGAQENVGVRWGQCDRPAVAAHLLLGR